MSVVSAGAQYIKKEGGVYIEDRKNKVFTATITGLVIDYTGYNGWTFNLKDETVIRTGHSCKINAGNDCTIRSGTRTTLNIGNNCLVRTGDKSIIKTGRNCSIMTFYKRAWDRIEHEEKGITIINNSKQKIDSLTYAILNTNNEDHYIRKACNLLIESQKNT